MGQQISEEEKQQFSLHFWKSYKYRLISGVIQLHRGWNIQTRNFVLKKNERNELIHKTEIDSLTAIKGERCRETDCSPPGSTVHGIFQARILEWIAIPFSITYTHC